MYMIYGLAGTATLTVPVRVVAADPLPPSYRDIEWDPPEGETATAYRVYYTEEGQAEQLYNTYAGNVESARVADLTAEKSYTFRVEADYTATATGSATGATGAPPARVPQKRYVWAAGATQGEDTSGPSGGETYSTVRIALRNISGGSMTKLRAGFLTGRVAGATITKLYYSTDGNTWTQMQFGGVNSYTEARSIVGGADQSSNTVFSDALTLPAPVAAGGSFQLSIVRPAAGPSAVPLSLFTTGVTSAVVEFPRRKQGDFGDQAGWTGFDDIVSSPLQSYVMEYA